MIDDAAPAQYKPQVLTGTGTTEDSNERPFSKDRLHVLTVGATPVIVGFSKNKGLVNAVTASNGMILPAGSEFEFKAIGGGLESYGALYVYVEAQDGVSAYTVTVQQREA